MNDAPIEQLLRNRRGPRERGYVAIRLPVSRAEAAAQLAARRGGWLATMGPMAAWAGVAAVAVALVLSVAALTRGPSTNVGDGGTPTPTPTSAATGGSSSGATPSAGTGLPACQLKDFAWASDPWTGAAGARGTNVVFRAADSIQPCAIDSRPSLALRDANGALVESAGGGVAPRVEVGPGSVLEIGIFWSNWCGAQPAQPLGLNLTLAGDPTALPLVPPGGQQIPVPPCSGPQQPSALSVTNFQPSNRPPPQG
jgi:hypothetical protein